MRAIPRLAAVAAVALVVGACSAAEAPWSADEPEPEPDVGAVGADDADDATDEDPVACHREELGLGATDGVADDPAEVAARVALGTHACATAHLVVADDPAEAAVAAPLALSEGLPLLLEGDGGAVLPADLTTPDGDDPPRVSVEDLVEGLEPPTEPAPDQASGDAAGDDPADEPAPGAASGDDPADEPDPTGAADPLVSRALAVADHLDADTLFVADADRPRDLAAAALAAGRHGGAVLPLPAGEGLPAETGDRALLAVGRVADRVPEADRAPAVWATDGAEGTVWLLDPDDAAAAAVAVAAVGRGEAVVPIDGDDLRADRRAVRRVRDAVETAGASVLVGTVTADLDRQLPLLLEAPEVPGGGLTYFDGTRFVALYGKPGVPALGALGEQDLDATIERAREVSDGYDADGREVVPTLEVIVTVASRDAQDDESYSSVTPAEEFRDLVDRAAEEGFQVILDLQPGRTDFLTQAELYEDLLREPHVGLALDPEWRLEPDQVHLRQIGSVPAEEVQEVVDWLAALTRDAGQSQTLLVLHQFRLSMLPDRDTIEIPPEIAAVVHADGQGPQPMKDETWATLTREGADRWHWGWKNFYDEDPVVAGPDKILDLEPEVVLVTYQ